MLILRPLALLSFSSFLDSSLRLILRLILLSLPSFHFLALLPEDQLLEPQQRDLLLLQQAHHIEQGPQEPSDHSLILLAQCGLLDFLDQGLDFGRIDFGYLVVRFSHSSHTSVLRGTIASRFLACGAQSCHLHFARTIAQIHALLPKLHTGSDELEGSFQLEVAICENAASGKTAAWPYQPLKVRGNFAGLKKQGER